MQCDLYNLAKHKFTLKNIFTLFPNYVFKKYNP